MCYMKCKNYILLFCHSFYFFLIFYIVFTFFQVSQYQKDTQKKSYEIRINRHFRDLKKILKKEVSLIT